MSVAADLSWLPKRVLRLLFILCVAAAVTPLKNKTVEVKRLLPNIQDENCSKAKLHNFIHIEHIPSKLNVIYIKMWVDMFRNRRIQYDVPWKKLLFNLKR